MSRNFQRRNEDFVCQNCGTLVSGSGYTNHCPACLWSKHVDVNPGDRAAVCRGMMSPVAVESRRGQFRIRFRCTTCGLERWNKAANEDDFEVLLQIAADQAGSR